MWSFFSDAENKFYDINYKHQYHKTFFFVTHK